MALAIDMVRRRSNEFNIKRRHNTVYRIMTMQVLFAAYLNGHGNITERVVLYVLLLIPVFFSRTGSQDGRIGFMTGFFGVEA
jgi:hypothetical protein